MRAFRITFFLSGLLLLMGFASSHAQVNSMVNSGFEEGMDSGWSYNIINGSDVDIKGNGIDVYAGDSTLQLDIQLVGSGGPQVIGVYQDNVELSSGGKYLVSCAVKGPAGQAFRFRILGDIKQYKNFTLPSSGWNKYEFLIYELLPSADNQYRISLEFAFTDNTAGTWLIDEFKIEDFYSIPGNLTKVYVSPAGDDANQGTILSPLKTIGVAFEKLAGDTIYLMEGNYHEESVLSGKTGAEGSPIVITPVPGHKVIFDGTVPLSSDWELFSGNIYKTNFGAQVWQIFKGDTLLMPARWPNAFLHDGSVWDREANWAHGLESLSSNGIEVDDPSGANDLALSGIDATGAMAIMNVGSWKTSAREVFSHSSGNNTFEYDPVPFTYKPKHHYYYLEGTLELLDAPGEWCYDVSTGDIYVWAYDGSPPGSSLRGKDQSYALSFNNCNYIEVSGIDFFATTLSFENCTHAVVEDCDFSYPSSSKRALLSNAGPDVLQMKNSKSNPSNNSIINCSIRNTESHAFYLEGNTNLVENCRLENIDWVVADRPALMNSLYLDGENNVLRHTTISNCGASSTIFPGNFPIVEYNRVWSTGHLQSDGSITQVTIPGQPGSIIRRNWFHNTVKSGARFDAPIPPTVWGNGGAMQHNVIWNTNSGLMLKGEYHYCFNNTVYGTDGNGIILLDGSDGGGGNVGTITRNNISDKISGHRKNWITIPGIVDHNWNGYEQSASFNSQLLDPQNLDFRPDPNASLIDAGDFVEGFTIPFFGEAPDIGAYEYGDSIYWIAGRKLDIASTPVPGHTRTSSNSIVDLMWLQAYKAVAHDVYFSIDSAIVAEAERENEAAYLGRFTNNIVSPGMLVTGQKYYWRVDALMNDGSVNKGKLWFFTAGADANIPPIPNDSIMFEIYGREGNKIFQMDSALININGQEIYTDSSGHLKLVLPRQEYAWEVTKIDFESSSASFFSENDLLVRDTLDRIHAELTFMLSSEGVPFGGAEVILGSESGHSETDGMVVFYPVTVNEDHSYAVSSGGYENVEGSISIEGDTTLKISMEPLGFGDEWKKNPVLIYPVPAHAELFVDNIPSSVVTIQVYNIGGARLLEKKVYSVKSSISLENYKAGEYVIKLTDSQGSLVFKSGFVVM